MRFYQQTPLKPRKKMSLHFQMTRFCCGWFMLWFFYPAEAAADEAPINERGAVAALAWAKNDQIYEIRLRIQNDRKDETVSMWYHAQIRRNALDIEDLEGNDVPMVSLSGRVRPKDDFHIMIAPLDIYETQFSLMMGDYDFVEEKVYQMKFRHLKSNVLYFKWKAGKIHPEYIRRN